MDEDAQNLLTAQTKVNGKATPRRTFQGVRELDLGGGNANLFSPTSNLNIAFHSTINVDNKFVYGV